MTNLKDTTTIVQNKAYSGSFQFVVNVNVNQCQCQSSIYIVHHRESIKQH